MKRQMKKLVLGVASVVVAFSLMACGKDSGDEKVDTNVQVETGDVETNVEVDTGDVEAKVEDDTEATKTNSRKISIDKYVGGTAKAINQAGYKYVGYSKKSGKYVVQYVIYDIEPDVKTQLIKLQGSNIAKILIKDDTVELGYEPNGEKYKFNLKAGSVYMNFELVGSELVIEQYRYEDDKTIRDMGELHSIPIINLQIDYMYCYAIFDEAGSAIVETDNFNEDTAQEMLSSCVVEEFYYVYGLME